MNNPVVETLTEEQAAPIFFRLLGELHHSYTALEHELTCVVFMVATRSGQRKDDVLIALLGGQRMGPLKDTIKRLLRATKADEARKTFVEKVFLQLGEIQFFRDRLAHYITVMSDYNPECWVNMNYTGIRERGKMEDIHFNIWALKTATDDLSRMRAVVSNFFSHYPDGNQSEMPALPSWQYKPSMLVRDHPKSDESQK